ncbi:MAG TPA: hypothetical protein VF310_01330 [Vicinamibacteria bacterium]
MLPTTPGRVIALTVLLTAPLAGPAAAAQEDEATLAERAARAEAILAREEGHGRPFDVDFRKQMKARLQHASDEELEAVEKRGSGLISLMAPLDNAHDLVYTPVAPCRVIDTRTVSGGGPILVGTNRSFIIAGAGGCGVPFGPTTAVVLNYVAVAPAGPGDLRAWPFGGTVPTASVINYAQVTGLNIANALVQPICVVTGPGTCSSDITVQADVSSTGLVADVVGYFSQFPKANVRSFTNTVVSAAGTGPLPGGCTNAGGTQITVDAPVAGRIVVHGKASLRVQHATGTSDEIWTAIGTSATDCPPTDFGRSILITRVPAALPTFNSTSGGTLVVQSEPVRVVDVAAGSYTFYLNFLPLTGGGDDDATHRSMEATFYPN